MAIFLVVSMNDSPNLTTVIAEKYPNDHFVVGKNQWLVSADDITTKVSDNIGISEGKFGNVIVTKMDSYYGWHRKDMWEWVGLKGAK